MGRQVEVVETDKGISVAASDLGLPRCQYPARIRMRDENGKVLWFDLLAVAENRDSAMYQSGEMQMIVVGVL